MAKVPHFIEVVIFERKGDDGVVIGTNNIAEMFVCKQYYKIGIQLVNKDGQPIAYRPDFPRSNASKYKVAISLPDLNIDYGTTNTLYRYDPGTNTDVVNETHTSLQDSYYAAYSVTIKRVGITPLKVVVFDGTDEILERIVHFEVTTAIPSGYRVEWGEEYEKKLAFGDFLPTFKIQFVDNDNEDLPFYGVAIVSISSDLVDIVCTKENGAYLVDIKNSGSINCKKGDWICKPLNQRATKAGSKSGIDASLTLKLSIVDDTQRVIQIGNETHTHLCCTAGLPYSLELVMPMITPISCKADDHLPSITLSVLDEWGCLATTGPYEWRAILSCDLLDLAVNSFELQNGNIVIPPIPLKIPEHMTISSVGLSSVCSLELACNTLNGEKIYQPRIDIPINVFASVYPHTLHVSGCLLP